MNDQTFTVRSQRTEVIEVHSHTIHTLHDPDQRANFERALPAGHDLANPTRETLEAIAQVIANRMARRIEREHKTSLVSTHNWNLKFSEYPAGDFSQFTVQITGTVIIHQSSGHEYTHNSPPSWDDK